MSKTIISTKLLISQDSDGNLSDVILQYKLNDSGVVSGTKTVSVKNALNEQDILSMIDLAVDSASQSEGIV